MSARLVSLPCALTVAGSDPDGGAGIQADLKTFSALGVYGATVLTCITVQNTREFLYTYPLPPELVRDQIRVLSTDLNLRAAKTGMLFSKELVSVVSKELKRLGLKLVVDPVVSAKTGGKLLGKEALKLLKEELIPIATVTTPNAEEASLLTGVKVKTVEDAKKAAKTIAEMGSKCVVVKGGHLSTDKCVDVVYIEGSFKLLEGERVKGGGVHGTGCIFSAAITAGLALGMGTLEAIKLAKEVVSLAILFGVDVGLGFKPANPMAKLYRDAEKYVVLECLSKAVRKLEENKQVTSLIPEVSSNLAMATRYAVDLNDVAGIPGRIVKLGDRVKAVSCPGFGASRHVASAVLTAMTYNPNIRACMNIRFSDETLKACKALRFTVSFYDRREEPAEVKSVNGRTIRWGVEQAVKRAKKFPDIIYHTGDWGKEPMVLVFGKDALEVVDKVLRIAGRIGGVKLGTGKKV